MSAEHGRNIIDILMKDILNKPFNGVKLSQRQEQSVDKHEHKVLAHNRYLSLRFLFVVFSYRNVIYQVRNKNEIDKEQDQG